MEAVAKAKVEDFSGKPKKKSTGVAKFDVNAALAEQGPGASTSHYVAGSSVTVTDEAEAMDDMISDMQKEQAFEQELQEKGCEISSKASPRWEENNSTSVPTKAHKFRAGRSGQAKIA